MFVKRIGLGCMNLSHGYGNIPSYTDAERLLLTALDNGIDFFDTAAVYGKGANEELIGNVLGKHRNKFTLASKCGMRNVNGVREINNSPKAIRETCIDSLRKLQTDVIDLYYLHRYDKVTLLEDSIGELSKLVEEGKIRYIGVSEVSADTLRKANKIHKITAIQSEYSLCTRNPEIAVLDVCKELDIDFVAFSPLSRGLLANVQLDNLLETDIRRYFPRLVGDYYRDNLLIMDKFNMVARELCVKPSTLALSWLISKDVIPIPGTTSVEHLLDNIKANDIILEQSTIDKIESIVNQNTIHGARYNSKSLQEVDSEEYA